MSSTLVLDPAKVARRSSLGRDVDPRLPSNRLAIVGALLAALATGLAAQAGLEIGLSPFSAALGVFLSWAIARELDPDHPAAAAIALPVSFVLLVLVGPSSLLVSTGLLLGARMTAGTVGTPLRLLDVVGIVALSALLGTSVVGAVGVAAMGVGVLVDEPRRERALAVVGSAAVAFAAAALVTGVEWAWMLPDTSGWVVLVIGVAATLLVIPAAPPDTPTDRTGDLVQGGRVTAARVVAGVGVVAAFILAGGTGIAALAGTSVAALAATSIRQIMAGRN
jgi:hypothetical protein